MSVIVQYTQSGEAHGLVDVFTNSCEDNDFKFMKPADKEKLIKQRKEDARLVEMEYINRKGGHERLDKHYVKYAGERIEKWHCIPGKRYTVPMGLVKEVNEMKLPPKRSGLVSLDGQELNKNGAPIEADQEADWEHRFVPTKY
jgi:hypothetical protein